MLLTVGAVITLSVTVALYRAWALATAVPRGHGYISQQWLVEHRATERE